MTRGPRILAAVLAAGGAYLAANHGLKAYYYSKTYNYYDTASVYWEDQHTFLLYLPHRQLLWSLKPNIRMKVAEKAMSYGLHKEHIARRRHEWEIHVGPKGFRGDDFQFEKPPGELRVVCFGDSRTIGEGLRELATYPARLEAMLRPAMPNSAVRVLNLGADGWSSHQGLTLLQSQVAAWRPDVAVFAFGINDADTELGISDRDRARLMDTPAVSVQRTLFRSMVFYWAQRQFLQARGWLLGKTPVKKHRGGDRPRVSAAEYADNVRQFVAACKRAGILPLVLIVPVNPYREWDSIPQAGGGPDPRVAEVEKLGADRPRSEAIGILEARLRSEPDFDVARYALAGLYRDEGDVVAADRHFMALVPSTVFHRYNEAARRAAEAEGGLVLDLTERYHERRDELLYVDALHPNDRGAELIAEALASAIRSHLAPSPQASSRGMIGF